MEGSFEAGLKSCACIALDLSFSMFTMSQC
jgi:hypothetical protein